LPADGPAFLADVDQAAVLVEVLRAQSERSAAAARGFGVQPQDEGVEFGVIAGGGDGVVDLGELRIGQRSPGGRLPPRFGDLQRGIDRRWDMAVVGCLAVEKSVAGVTAAERVEPDVLGEFLDLRGGGFVEPPSSPRLRHVGPVGTVDTAGGVADRVGDDGDVLGERRCCLAAVGAE
jgi:hypothetical protein